MENSLRNFWQFWNLLTTYDNFDYFSNFWQFWIFFGNFDNFFAMLTNVDKFWQILSRWSGPLIWCQTKPNPKVMWNILQLTFICVMNFAFILFPTESPLVKLGQFWPLLPSPCCTKCYLIAKISLQHSIFMKSQKIGNLFFEHSTQLPEGLERFQKKGKSSEFNPENDEQVKSRSQIQSISEGLIAQGL